jgi:valyl-tRNA synthetase
MDKTFNAAEAEARIYAAWEEAGAFKAGANASPGAEAFSIMIPPPNVTGVLHVGHAFNNTLQDVLTRWHRMRGFDTLWQPGTDHAGIATQMVVERELAKSQIQRRDLSREEFLSHVWEWKAQSGGTIREQLKRLGASCDWSREAFTMSGAPGAPEGEDGNFHDAVIKVFVDMYQKGFIYRGKRLVNWDPHFETAISDLEVENTDVQGNMWHFKYPLAGGATYTYREKDEDGNVILEEERDYISIATTRPETMLGDGAVAVHPSDERYAPIVGMLCEIPVGPKEHRRLIPIITDEYPDPDFGSGAVKITGAHDFNDYAVAKRGAIPCYRLMDEKGHMREDGLPYAEAAAVAQEVAEGKRTLTEAEADLLNLVPDHLRGRDRFAARWTITAEIFEEGLAVMTRADDPRLGATALATGEEGADEMVPLVEDKIITQPIGDRSKVVIEPMLTDQWFVDTAKIVGPALDAVRDGRTTIVPEQHRKVYFHWLENIEPWTISRQLWWGHQIPVWYGFDLARHGFRDDEGDGALDEVEMLRLLNAQTLLEGEDHHHCAADFDAVSGQFMDVIGGLPTPLNHCRVVEVADQAAALHAFAESLARYEASQDPTQLVYPGLAGTGCARHLVFLRALAHRHAGLARRDRGAEAVSSRPMCSITGFDILFFWVARMIMMQYAVTGQKPFHTVYLHQLVRDEKGKKMSKTTGNVIDPLEIVDEYGADALALHQCGHGLHRRGPEAVEGPYRRLPQFRNEAVERLPLRRDEPRLRRDIEMCMDPADMGAPGAADREQLDPRRDRARARNRRHGACRVSLQRCGQLTLYAFVWGTRSAIGTSSFPNPCLPRTTRRSSNGDPAHCMAWVLDQCLILLHPGHALHHRGTLGHARHAAEDAGARRLAHLHRRRRLWMPRPRPRCPGSSP